MRTRTMGIFVCYALGIAAAYASGIISTLVLALVAVVIISAVGIFYRRGILFRFFLVFCVIAGAVSYMVADYADDGFNGEYVTIAGRICELPYTYDNGMYYYVVKPHSIIYMNKSEKFTERVLICSEKIYEYGDCISVSGFIDKFDKRKNDTDFNSEVYHKSHGIFYKMTDLYSEYSEKYYVISARDSLLSIHNIFAKYIESRYTGRAYSYLKAIILGDMHNFDDTFSDIIICSGARRYLYSSFIHISIIVFILGVVFKIFKTKRYTRDSITAVIFLLYAACMSTHPVFIKSLTSAVFVIMYKKKFGYINKADAVAVSGIAVLLSNPFFIFDAGFVVAVTFSVLNIMFADKIADIFVFLQKYRYSFSQWIIGAAGVMPVYAFYFGGMPMYTPIMQIFAVPLAFAIIVLFPISMAEVCVFGTKIISNGLLSAAMYTLDFVAEFIASLPFSYMFIPKPTLYQTALFYSVLAAIYVGFTEIRKRERILMPITVSVLMAIIVGKGYIDDIGKLKLMFVNVGQGDGAVVSVNYREKLLIDGGGSEVYSDFDVGKYIYVPFLRSKGIYGANAIVTHYHKDHCQGILSAIDGIHINTLFMPDIEPDNEFRIKLEERAKARNVNIEYVRCGDEIKYQSGLSVKFVSPDEDDIKNGDMNGASLAAYVNYGEFSALFTGDATADNERKIIDKGLAEKCNVLKVGHHGSATSSSKEFIRAVNPETAVISVGEDNTYNLPDDEVLDVLSDINVIRTDECGNVTITADKTGKYGVETFKNGDSQINLSH